MIVIDAVDDAGNNDNHNGSDRHGTSPYLIHEKLMGMLLMMMLLQ